jgi:sarcosine oxidase, subunit delta
MQLIECPWCGPREEIEFHYGGEAHIAYPDHPAELDDVQWAHYVFFRNNTRGVFAERWNHAVGCRRWFNALRDTVTYRFVEVYRIGEKPSYATDEALPILTPEEPVPAELESSDIR